MSILDLINETQDSLEEARDELETYLIAVDDMRNLITNLEDELHGLRLAANRRGESMENEDPSGTVVAISSAIDLPGSKATSLAHLSRSDAVAHVLAMTDRPLDRQAVATRLETLGRVGDTLDQISLALTNLKRSGRATKAGNGRWRAALTAQG